MSVLCVISTMMRPCASRMARKWTSALSSKRSDVLVPFHCRQNWMLVICGTSFSSNWLRRIGSSSGMSSIGILLGRQHAADLILPVLPRVRPPEVVGPQEAALQEVFPQPGGMSLGESNRAGIGGEDASGN